MIRFLVFSDLHYDALPDGDARVEALAARIEAVRPDFVLSLGDLCRPVERNRAVLRRLEAAGAPVHHLVGNHNTDHCSLRETLDFFGLERDHYAFTVDGVRFLMLNAGDGKSPCLPDEQLDWLRQEIADDSCDMLSARTIASPTTSHSAALTTARPSARCWKRAARCCASTATTTATPAA